MDKKAWELVSLIILAVILSSCSASTEGWKIRKFTEFCSDKGGIHHIHNGAGEYAATCNDGKWANIEDIRLDK